MEKSIHWWRTSQNIIGRNKKVKIVESLARTGKGDDEDVTYYIIKDEGKPGELMVKDKIKNVHEVTEGGGGWYYPEQLKAYNMFLKNLESK